MRIKGSTVVITGASSGVGRAAAVRYAKSGANLVLAARDAEALEDAAETCREQGVIVLTVPTDVTDARAVDQLAKEAVREFAGIDVWINNASVSLFASIADAPLEDFRRVLDVNIMGYVHGARAALRYMRPQGQGVLINVSSVVGHVPQPYTAAYSISKAGVNALSVSLRSELALDKFKDIHVVTVLPPTIDTPFFDQVANATGRKVLAMPPVHSPEEVAEVLLKAARKPRHDMPVGSAAKQMIRQHRVSPASVESLMAQQVDKKHLSSTQPAAATHGNLFQPSPSERHELHGGWDGRRRQAGRRLLATGALVAAAAGGLAVLGRQQDRPRRRH
ncbi:SDR family oxidoreductase [Nesterenkonia lutea]|uniref:Short-subunit dehydrogenase n=1 Tax=Nesterenkonia lutea TaxID=272919 RepID=A0ABR9JG33_9MICC|nr:SDR family oxidoreductase [Nesterenkonia lutea]MBE1524898.1 short-subunit dehydrogenase [Nesterenkonia lutea]